MKDDRALGWPTAVDVLHAFGAPAVVEDGGGRIVYANEGAERRFGRPPGRLTGDMLASIVQEAERDRTASVLSRRVRAGHTWRGRLGLPDRDGSARETGIACSRQWEGNRVAGWSA